MMSLGLLFWLSKDDIQEGSRWAGKAVRLMNRVVHPSALFILVSGIMMFVEMGLGSDKPFWLIFMERGGTVVLLLSIVWVTLQGNKLKKKLEGKSMKKQVSLTSLCSRYSTSAAVSVLLALVVVLVVSLKIV